MEHKPQPSSLRVGGDLSATKLFFLEFIVPNDLKNKTVTFELPMLTFELPFFSKTHGSAEISV